MINLVGYSGENPQYIHFNFSHDTTITQIEIEKGCVSIWHGSELICIWTKFDKLTADNVGE